MASELHHSPALFIQSVLIHALLMPTGASGRHCSTALHASRTVCMKEGEQACISLFALLANAACLPGLRCSLVIYHHHTATIQIHSNSASSVTGYLYAPLNTAMSFLRNRSGALAAACHDSLGATWALAEAAMPKPACVVKKYTQTCTCNSAALDVCVRHTERAPVLTPATTLQHVRASEQSSCHSSA